MRVGPPDAASVEDRLRQQGKYAQVSAELLNCINDPHTVEDVRPWWIDEMRKCHLRRSLWHLTQQVATLSLSSTLDPVDETIRLAERLRVLAEACYAEEDVPDVLTLDELLQETFPAARWAIPGIVPEGLTLLAAKPKIGNIQKRGRRLRGRSWRLQAQMSMQDEMAPVP